MIRSLGLRSDLIVLHGLSEVEDHADRVVVRTPSEPTYWHGNLVIFRDDHVDAAAQLAAFRRDFPESEHVTLTWDAPDMRRGAAHDGLVDMGFDIEETDVLTRTGPVDGIPVPDGVLIRPIETDADWKQVTALHIETGVAEGYTRQSYTAFMRTRFINRRRQVAAGQACWLGAFDGDLLVGDLGVYQEDGIARYQDVETRESHRRRGICAALVAAGADWALARNPATILLILADGTGAAGRVYRHCGFSRTETIVSATRRAEGSFVAVGTPD